MNRTIVHHEGVRSLERTGRKIKRTPAVIKIGLDVHARVYVVVAESDALLPIPVGLRKLATVVLSREICDWHRFHNRRTISSYTGLYPSERSSGSKRVPGSVTKRGNPRVRAALAECACPESFRGSSRSIRRSPNGSVFSAKARALPARCASRNAARRARPGFQGDRGGGATSRGRPVAHPHRPLPRGTTGLEDLISIRHQPRRAVRGKQIPT
jgi:hypothetical protein